MQGLIGLHDGIFARIERLSPAILPTLARLIFAGVLLIYFWNSARTKVGPGFFGFLHPSTGGYAQIFPKAMEAVQFDISKMTAFHWLVVEAGIVAEFLLPLLIVLGLATRLAALGMIGFVLVQSLTDIYGHGIDAGTIGTWFDRASDAVILDQRAFWVLGLSVLVFLGAGPLSVDRFLRRSA
jgi:putative oxidoreductase